MAGSEAVSQGTQNAEIKVLTLCRDRKEMSQGLSTTCELRHRLPWLCFWHLLWFLSLCPISGSQELPWEDVGTRAPSPMAWSSWGLWG